jgi:hypothetical protein
VAGRLFLGVSKSDASVGMKIRIRVQSGFVFTVALSVPFILAAQTQEGLGVINGTVLDEFGQPVEHAQVYEMVLQGEKIITVLNTHTDDIGGFRFEHLQLGEYGLYAAKLEAGYETGNSSEP